MKNELKKESSGMKNEASFFFWATMFPISDPEPKNSNFNQDAHTCRDPNTYIYSNLN